MAADYWQDARELSVWFQEDGWWSPDTYARHFRELPTRPAVYVLMPYCREFYARAFVAYVGMSIDVQRRLAGHEVLREIKSPSVWVKRWFKPTPTPALRDVERRYIQRFDPPWNLVGRKKGIALS